MISLWIASKNAHKVQEIQALLGNGAECRSTIELAGAPEIEETAPTFEGNARLKSEGLARWLIENPSRLDAPPFTQKSGGRFFVLADDSGLEVDVLDGAPGVLSARFAAMGGSKAGNSSDPANNEKLLTLLQEVPDEKRTARFRCVLALTEISGSLDVSGKASLAGTEFFEGSCEGRILREGRGQGGFGYDPLFAPPGYEGTFAELGETVKNRISHRAKALAKLRAFIQRL